MAFSNIFSVVFLYPFLLLSIALSLSPSQLKPHLSFSHVPFHSPFVLSPPYLHSSSPTVAIFTFLVSVVIPDYKFTTKCSEPGSTEWVKKLRFLFWHIEIQIIHAVWYVVRLDRDMSCIPMLVHDRRQNWGAMWFDLYEHFEPNLAYV